MIDFPLESRERAGQFKKLCTAVSIESPDVFRIRGVPCIDRGADRSRPPVTYEHWNGCGGYSDVKATGDTKKNVNFARPSSVSADTPNFFKVPGVAINCSSAITGVEAVCSPPPKHPPFRLPATYMHSRDASAVVDPVNLPGRWREADREVSQWGHATQEFHRALVKKRSEGATWWAQHQGTPSSRPKDHRDCTEVSAPLPRRSMLISSARASIRTPQLGSGRSRDSARPNDAKRDADVWRKKARGRRASAVEIFMSRLEGERGGPLNRRESVAAFKQMLQGCPTNNSAQLAENIPVEGTTTRNEGSAEAGSSTNQAKGAALRRVLNRREAAQRVVSRLMGTEGGSYMLSREADASKICLGRKRHFRRGV